MIVFNQKGNFKKLNRFLEKAKEKIKIGKLDYYGKEGVNALEQNTPIDTGLTAKSWYYTIERKSEMVSILFNNSNINDNVKIAIILQYGHGTKNGGWVEGRDYINPSIQPIFDKIAKDAWKEVTKT